MLNRLVQPNGNSALETTKQTLAINFEIDKEDVVLIESGSSITSSSLLYHQETQSTWDPMDATGSIISISFNIDGSANLVTTTGSFNIVKKSNLDALKLKIVNNVSDLRSSRPKTEGERVLLLEYNTGTAQGGGELISVSSSGKTDDGGIYFSSGNASLFWVRQERIESRRFYLEDFGAVESDSTDSSDAIINAIKWPLNKKDGLFKISAFGGIFKISKSLGILNVGYAVIDMEKNTTFYFPDTAEITSNIILLEVTSSNRNSVEGDYYGRQRVINNLSVKGTSRQTSKVEVLYLHDVWGISVNVQYHGVLTGVIFGNNVWSVNFHDSTQSAQVCWTNRLSTGNAGEEITVSGKSAFYNSGQFLVLSNYQFFVNCFGTSFDYSPSQLNLPVLTLGNSVVSLHGCHIEYAGPSYAPFATTSGDFGSLSIFGGTILIVVNSTVHYDYFVETRRDYQFSIIGTSVFGTRMIKCLCPKRIRYAPLINYGSTQNTGRITDNGGNVLSDPLMSTGAFKDKWFITGGTLTSRQSSNFVSIEIEQNTDAASGYGLKINKLVSGAGNNASVRLEFKANGTEFSPSLSFKLKGSANSTGITYINLNPMLVVGRDSTYYTPNTVRTLLEQRSGQISSLVADTEVTFNLGSIESTDPQNAPAEIFLLDINLQNLPIGTYHLYDLNICQGGK